MRLTELLDTLYYEFMAESAWMAHCYGFENMREYYIELVKHMKNNNVPTGNLIKSYKDVVNEYDRMIADPNTSFMNYEDTCELEKLDKEFLNCLAKSAQAVADKVGIEFFERW